MRYTCPPILLAAVLLIAPAEASEPAVELTAWFGGVTGGSIDDVLNNEELDIGDAANFAVSIGLPARQGGSYDFYLARQYNDLESGGLLAATPRVDLRIDYLQFGGSYGFDIERTFEPYVLLSAGVSRFDPEPPQLSSETFFAATIGAGMRFPLGERLTAKLETRAMVSLIDSDSTIFCDSGGGFGQCAIAIRGDALWQWSAAAGIAWRF